MFFLIFLLLGSAEDSLLSRVQEALGRKDLKEARRWSSLYLKGQKEPTPWRTLAQTFEANGQHEEALQILSEGRKTLKKDYLFAREFYNDALRKQVHEVALREVLNALL